MKDKERFKNIFDCSKVNARLSYMNFWKRNNLIFELIYIHIFCHHFCLGCFKCLIRRFSTLSMNARWVLYTFVLSYNSFTLKVFTTVYTKVGTKSKSKSLYCFVQWLEKNILNGKVQRTWNRLEQVLLL